MTDRHTVTPNDKVKKAASDLLESLQANNQQIKPETLQLIKKLARGEPMPAKKENTK